MRAYRRVPMGQFFMVATGIEVQVHHSARGVPWPLRGMRHVPEVSLPATELAPDDVHLEAIQLEQLFSHGLALAHLFSVVLRTGYHRNQWLLPRWHQSSYQCRPNYRRMWREWARRS